MTAFALALPKLNNSLLVAADDILKSLDHFVFHIVLIGPKTECEFFRLRLAKTGDLFLLNLSGGSLPL